MFHVEPLPPRYVLHRSNAPVRQSAPFAVITLARYAALLEAREVRRLFLASVLGRLPIGVTGLSILILVQSASGSFSAGGAATACYVVGLALAAPALGRLIDRHGPRRILIGAAVIFPAALASLVAAVRDGALLSGLLFAALAGASFPPITVCMRTLLRQKFGHSDLLSAAYSLESVLIELIFIAGPMLVALLVSWVSPAAAVLTAGACGGLGTALFMRSPAMRRWRIEERAARSLLGPLGSPGFLPLIGVVLCYSTAFGLMEIGVTAYATEHGSASLAGVLLGLMSAGSAVGGIAYGSRNWRPPLTRQFALMLGLMACGLALLALPWQPFEFAALSVFAGVVMAPALIIQSVLVAKRARPEHTTEAFTWSTSALLAGIGAGLAAGGAMLDDLPSHAALAAGALTAFVGAAAAWKTLGPT